MSSTDIPTAEEPPDETPLAPAHREAIATHESRNLLVLALYHVVSRIAWIFKTESVIVPAFLDTIAGAGWLRGCLPVLNRASQSVPPLFFADRLRRTTRKKWPLLATTQMMGAPFLVLSAIWFLLAEKRQWWLPAVFFLLYVLFFVAAGLNQLCFGTVQGKLIRAERRGRLIGISGGVGALASILCAWILLGQWLALPDGGYGHIFGFTGIAFVAAGLVCAAVFEPADEPTEKVRPRQNQFRDAWTLVRRDRNLRRVAIVGTLFMTHQLLFPHYQALGRERLPFENRDLMVWVIAQNAGIGIFSPLAGALADRFGNRLTLRICICSVAFIPLLAIGLTGGYVAGAEHFFWVTFLLIGLVVIAFRSLMNYTLEICDESQHPQYLSTLKLWMAVPFLLSPLVGWLVDAVSFEAVFITIAALVALGGLLTFRLAEPRHQLR